MDFIVIMFLQTVFPEARPHHNPSAHTHTHTQNTHIYTRTRALYIPTALASTLTWEDIIFLLFIHWLGALWGLAVASWENNVIPGCGASPRDHSHSTASVITELRQKWTRTHTCTHTLLPSPPVRRCRMRHFSSGVLGRIGGCPSPAGSYWCGPQSGPREGVWPVKALTLVSVLVAASLQVVPDTGGIITAKPPA